MRKFLLGFIWILFLGSLGCNSKIESGPVLGFPLRDKKALSGSEFAKKIENINFQEREDEYYNQISKMGNMPEHFKYIKEIKITETIDGKEYKALIYVFPDYISIGSNEDYFRVPMSPMTAQKIADLMGCTLPTRKIVDEIYKSADMKLEPKPLTEKREAASTFWQHNQIIQEQIKGKPFGSLIAGIKKDIVLTNKLKAKPTSVAIYGWHKLDGKAIQPVSTVHRSTYVDYSHGARLVMNMMKIVHDNKTETTTVQNILKDPKLSVLLSDEGPIDPLKY